jgi:hypothetical protein
MRIKPLIWMLVVGDGFVCSRLCRQSAEPGRPNSTSSRAILSGSATQRTCGAAE